MAAAPADDYDYSKDAIVLVEEPDSDTEPTDTDRKINPHNLENADELKAGGFGVSVRSTEELKTSGIFSMEEDSGGVRWMATKPWKGAIVAPSAAPRNIPTEPSASLTLEWMHGYHGFDARSNLVYNAAGHIVYPIAGVVVVYDQKEHKQRHFMGHNDEVTCLAQSPVNPNIIATGQVATIVNRRATPPHICVWDSSSKPFTQIKIPNAGQRSIRCLGFSHDGKLLASVGNDDKQTVTLWDWQSKTKLAYLEGDASKVYAIRWNTKVPGEFVTAGEKHLYFYSWNGTVLKRTKARMGGKYAWQSFFSLAFTDKGNTCVGGYDGSISVFMGGECKKCVKVSANKVNSLEFFPGGIIAGSSDCKIALCDKALQSVRQISLPGKVSAVHIRGDDILAGTMTAEIFELPGALSATGFRTAPASEAKLAPVVSGHFDGELWGAAPAPDGKTFISCGEDNRVHKWDLAHHRLIGSAIIEAKRAAMPKVLRASTASTHPPNQCARAVAINPSQTEFAVGGNDGVVHVYDFATLVKKHSLDLNQHGKRVVTGQKGNWIQVLKYSPSGAMLAVGTHGSVICLLDPARGYATRAVLDKHNSFITHLDWSLDGQHMQSNDGAYELLFWSIDEKEPRNSRQNTSATGTKDVVWASQTCILGWSVQGIFDPSQDGTDVNTVDTSPSRTLIVTGDDYGDLNLFRFPCAAEGNAKKSYIGHSSHVVTTRFTSDERYVVSAGGADKALGVWRVTA